MTDFEENKVEPIPENELPAAIEAFLFAAGDPVSLQRLSEICGHSSEKMKKAMDALSAEMIHDKKRGVEIRLLEDSYVLTPKADMKGTLERMFQPKQRVPLSQAAYETLAVIAYNQPVTRSQIEAVRGVSSDSIVSRLLERGWIRECGFLEAPGHPSLFETTSQFLLEFGIPSVKELPALELMMYGTIRDLEESLSQASGNIDNEKKESKSLQIDVSGLESLESYDETFE